MVIDNDASVNYLPSMIAAAAIYMANMTLNLGSWVCDDLFSEFGCTLCKLCFHVCLFVCCDQHFYRMLPLTNSFIAESSAQ